MPVIWLKIQVWCGFDQGRFIFIEARAGHGHTDSYFLRTTFLESEDLKMDFQTKTQYIYFVQSLWFLYTKIYGKLIQLKETTCKNKLYNELWIQNSRLSEGARFILMTANEANGRTCFRRQNTRVHAELRQIQMQQSAKFTQ